MISFIKKLKEFICNQCTSEVIGVFLVIYGICFLTNAPEDLRKAVGGNSCNVKYQDSFQSSSYGYLIIHLPTP